MPIQPGLVLDKEDCLEAGDPVKQKFYHVMAAKIQHCVPGSTAHKILLIGWAVALGSVDSPDGVSVIYITSSSNTIANT